EKTVVGFVNTRAGQDDDLDATVGEVVGLYVSPTWFGQGIGTRLCRRAFTLLGEHGFQTVVLWVLTDNKQARGFYQRLGLAPDRVTRVQVVGGGPPPIVRYRGSLDTAGTPPSS